MKNLSIREKKLKKVSCYLKLLCKLFPLVVSEGGDVEVDQLGGELGELVVEAD